MVARRGARTTSTQATGPPPHVQPRRAEGGSDVEVFGAVTSSNLPRGVYLRGNVYWITWRDLQGKRHREPAGTVLRDAVTARELRMADRHNARFNIARKAPTLVEFVDEHYRVEVMPGLKPSTREGYETLLKTHLLPELGNTKLSDITRAKIRWFIATRGKLAPNTMRNAVALLSGIL